MDFEGDNPVPLYDETSFKKYFNVETESMAAPGYAESNEATLRGIAARVIVQVSAFEFLLVFFFCLVPKIIAEKRNENGVR